MKLQERFKLDSDSLRAVYEASGSSRAEFVDLFADICCESAAKPRWAEKTPRNVLHLDYLFERFPDARFAESAAQRAGRGVFAAHASTASCREWPAGVGEYVEADVGKYTGRSRDSLLAAKPFCSGPRFYTLRYEELVSEPRAAIRKLLEFLGEPGMRQCSRTVRRSQTFATRRRFRRIPRRSSPSKLRRSRDGSGICQPKTSRCLRRSRESCSSSAGMRTMGIGKSACQAEA